MKTIALIAHDKKKSEMLEFVGHHKELLSKFHLIATRTTGTLINVAVGNVDYVIFLRDPLTSQPHEPDINALLRLCDVHDVPLATNRKSGHILLAYAAAHMEDKEEPAAE